MPGATCDRQEATEATWKPLEGCAQVVPPGLEGRESEALSLPCSLLCAGPREPAPLSRASFTSYMGPRSSALQCK